VRNMRAMFAIYVLGIATGLAFYGVIGLFHH
jgi:hypothetical protein